MRACWRCHALSDTVTLRGEVWLCPQCPILPFCGAFQHQYVGAETPGTLVCLACGSVVKSVPISTAVVEVPPTQTQYVDC